MAKLKNRKIKSDKWYLVDTINKKDPRLIRRDFRNKKDVERVIEKKLKNGLRWHYISGKNAIATKLKFKRRRRFNAEIEIYDYYPEDTTPRERKTFRTKSRRHAKKKNKKSNKKSKLR